VSLGIGRAGSRGGELRDEVDGRDVEEAAGREREEDADVDGAGDTGGDDAADEEGERRGSRLVTPPTSAIRLIATPKTAIQASVGTLSRRGGLARRRYDDGAPARPGGPAGAVGA
jgi:hypothetical protein